MTWLSKAVKGVSKATTFAVKATTNPMGAAADLLKSGQASKTGTPKTPTAVKTTSTPQKSSAQTKSTTNGTQQGGIMGWFRGTWSIFGMQVQRWVVILIVFVLIYIGFVLIKRRMRRATGRRRTYAARRARAMTRRRRRSPVRRK